jgi:hypothetical protein
MPTKNDRLNTLVENLEDQISYADQAGGVCRQPGCDQKAYGRNADCADCNAKSLVALTKDVTGVRDFVAAKRQAHTLFQKWYTEINLE